AALAVQGAVVILVAGQAAHDHVHAGGGAFVTQRADDQLFHALADVGGDDVLGERRQPHVLAHGVGGVRQVGDRVQQGAVQVEQNSGKVHGVARGGKRPHRLGGRGNRE